MPIFTDVEEEHERFGNVSRANFALCDDKIIDALVERNSIVEKIMAYKETYGMPILRPAQEAKRQNSLIKSLRGINIRKRFRMYFTGFLETASGYRRENCFHTILF